MVLNHLADHFFFKKDFDKVQHLALHAFHNTENEFLQAESCYQLARCFHVQGDLDQAFQYYYQATQYASPLFILPYYGLGQMYIFKNDKQNAAVCFEKVLKSEPGNYETMKILGSLYAVAEDAAKRERAKQLLKQVTDQHPDDVEAWIEYAQILEQYDLQGALSAYEEVIKILKDQLGADVPPEILNNVAALQFRLGNLPSAEAGFEQALERSKSEQEHDEKYYNAISLTTYYNLGRLKEASYLTTEAEQIYKAIIKEYPSYIDCYLRLGCMARNREQIYEASDWFKEALQVNQNSPDIWALIGNLHLCKNEAAPGQKKFERILQTPGLENDTYSLVALGNVWLQTLHVPNKDKEKEAKYQERALVFYKQVLKLDPRNLYAANGCGCVLAHKGFLREARDIFSQVREATTEMIDVWVNLAHIYVEQRQYLGAIQMYESCMDKFGKQNDVELLLYLGRAFVKAQKLEDAMKVLIRARHADPTQSLVLFNLSLVMQKLATQTLKDEQANLAAVMKAVSALQLAKKQLIYLSENGDKMKFDLRVARVEASHCDDLVNQAAYHIRRATAADQLLKTQQAEQEKERLALKLKQDKEEEEKRLKKEQEAQEMLQKRQSILEKTKSLVTVIGEIPADEPVKKIKSKSRKNMGDIYSSGDEGVGGSSSRQHSKPRHRDRDRERRHGDRKDRKSGGGGGERAYRRMTKEEQKEMNAFIDDEEFMEHVPKEMKERVKRQRMIQDYEGMTAKQRAKVKSKAYISSSESEGDDSDDGGKGKKGGGRSPSPAPTSEGGGGGDAPAKKRMRLDSDSSTAGDAEESDHEEEASKSKAKIDSDSD